MSFSVIVCFGLGNGLFWVYCTLCGQCLHLLFSKVTILRVSRQLSSQGQHVIARLKENPDSLTRSPLPWGLPLFSSSQSTVNSRKLLCHVFFRGCACPFLYYIWSVAKFLLLLPAWMAWDDVLFIQSATFVDSGLITLGSRAATASKLIFTPLVYSF